MLNFQEVSYTNLCFRGINEEYPPRPPVVEGVGPKTNIYDRKSPYWKKHVTGWCSTPTLLLICSSFSRENGHPLLICSSLSTAQVKKSLALEEMLKKIVGFSLRD